MESEELSLDAAIARLLADDEQLSLLSESVSGSSADCMRCLDQVDFLRLVNPRTGDSPGLDGEKARTLHARLTEIHDYVKSIRERKERTAMTASRLQIVKKLCEKEIAPFLSSDLQLDESPETLERALDATEKTLLEHRQQLQRQCAVLERFMDQVQSRLDCVQDQQASLRIVNPDNYEQALQQTVAELLGGEATWTDEDRLELRFGPTVLRLRLRMERGQEGLDIVSCESTGVPDELDNLKEMSLRWRTLSSLVVQLALREERQAKLRAAVVGLQNEFPLDWNAEENTLQLLTRSGSGQSVVCRLRPFGEDRFQLYSVTGLNVDSEASVAEFRPSEDACLRVLVEELVCFCASH